MSENQRGSLINASDDQSRARPSAPSVGEKPAKRVARSLANLRFDFDPPIRPLRDLPRFQIRQTSGDPSAVAPPVPIPNTEVKRCSPDDSASLGGAKVGRRQYYNPALRKRRAGFSFA